jgi:hypothetical protein
MTGEVFIDNNDIWTAYGMILLAGSYNDLLKPSKRKASLSNNWQDENGLEIDLTDPKYEAKTVGLSFILSADSEAEWWNRYNVFFALIKGSGEHSLYIKELSQIYQVYYIEVTSFEQITRIKTVNKVVAKFTISFGIANPDI